MIEDRCGHSADAFSHSGVHKDSVSLRLRYPALYLPALALRKMCEQLMNTLAVWMKSQIKMALSGIERQHCAQPDVKLHQLGLRFPHTHNHRTVPGPQAQYGCLLHFFSQLRKIVFSQFHNLHAANRRSAKLDQQRPQGISAFALRTQEASLRKRSQITVRGGAPQVQRGGEFPDFHLAAIARKNFQYA